MSFKKLSKGVFAEISETTTTKSAVQSFTEMHEAELNELIGDYSRPTLKKTRDYYDAPLLEEYKEAIERYKQFTNNPSFIELINTLSELENRIIKSNSILNLEIKLARQKQNVGDTQKEWVIAKSHFKQEGANQYERVYLGKVLEDGRIEDTDGNVYDERQGRALEQKAVTICVSRMKAKLEGHQSLDSIQAKLARLAPGEP